MTDNQNLCISKMLKSVLFSHLSKSKAVETIVRSYATPKRKSIKVTVCGAAGKIGQALSLMLKQATTIDKLVLTDAATVNGIAMDLSHVDTPCKVMPQSGLTQMEEAFKHSDIVVVVACAKGMSNAPYMTMFEKNAGLVKCITEIFAKACPQALLIIASNPVNSLVPLVSEILAGKKVLNTKKIFGITSLNTIRANTFVAEAVGQNPEHIMVPVIGGNSDATIVPLLSQITPCTKLSVSQLETITHRLQMANYDIMKVKVQHEIGYLSCSFAIAKFVLSVVKAIQGANNVIKCAFVRSEAHPSSKYLATPLLLGKEGIEENFGVPTDISEYERCLLEHAVPLIMSDVKRGEMFVGVDDPTPCDPCNSDPNNPCPKDWCA